MKSLYILALAASVISCVPFSNKMLIDQKFTEQERILIDHAINEWVEATGSIDAVIFVRHGTKFADEPGLQDWVRADDFARMYKIKHSDPMYKTMNELVDPGVNGFAGMSRRGQAVAMVEDQFYNSRGEFFEEWFYSVILHELGHFYGVGHSEHGLMSQPDSPICVDLWAVNEFCMIHTSCVAPHPTCK
jgi:hypothetical protein